MDQSSEQDLLLPCPFATDIVPIPLLLHEFVSLKQSSMQVSMASTCLVTMMQYLS